MVQLELEVGSVSLITLLLTTTLKGFPDSSVGKKSTYNSEDPNWFRKIPWIRDRLPTPVFLGFPYGSVSKEAACNAGYLGWIPESGRSPGEGNGNPLLYSCLRNPMDRGYISWSHKELDTTCN